MSVVEEVPLGLRKRGPTLIGSASHRLRSDGDTLIRRTGLGHFTVGPQNGIPEVLCGKYLEGLS